MKVCSGSSGDMIFGMQTSQYSNRSHVDLWFDGNPILDNPERYRGLIEKLIYLTVIISDITFGIGVLSRFMHQPREVHWTTALRILAYVKNFPGKVCCTRNMDMYAFSGYSDFGYAGDKGIKNLPLDIALLLEEILWLRGAWNKMWYLILVQRLNIESWLIIPARWCD